MFFWKNEELPGFFARFREWLSIFSVLAIWLNSAESSNTQQQEDDKIIYIQYTHIHTTQYTQIIEGGLKNKPNAAEKGRKIRKNGEIERECEKENCNLWLEIDITHCQIYALPL